MQTRAIATNVSTMVTTTIQTGTSHNVWAYHVGGASADAGCCLWGGAVGRDGSGATWVVTRFAIGAVGDCGGVRGAGEGGGFGDGFVCDVRRLGGVLGRELGDLGVGAAGSDDVNVGADIVGGAVAAGHIDIALQYVVVFPQLQYVSVNATNVCKP